MAARQVQWTQDEIRARNTAWCAAALRDEGPATIHELVGRTGFSRPTITAILKALQARGLVTQQEASASFGRPAAIYCFEPRRSHVLAVQEAEAFRGFIMTDLAGGLVGWSIKPVTNGQRRADLLSELDFFCRQVCRVDTSQIAMISLAVSGVVSSQGTLQRSCLVPELQGVNLRNWLGEATGADVLVANDVNLAALGEHAWGAGVGHEDLLYVRFDERFNTGLILGGQLREGFRGAAGEAGDLQIPEVSQEEASSAITSKLLAAIAATVDPEVIIISATARARTSPAVESLEESFAQVFTGAERPPLLQGRLCEAGALLGALEAGLRAANETVLGSPEIATPTVANVHGLARDLEREVLARQHAVIESAGPLRIGLFGHLPSPLTHALLEHPWHPELPTLSEAEPAISNLDAAIVHPASLSHSSTSASNDLLPRLATAGIPTLVVGAVSQTVEELDSLLTWGKGLRPALWSATRLMHTAWGRAVKEVLLDGTLGRLTAITSHEERTVRASSPPPAPLDAWTGIVEFFNWLGDGLTAGVQAWRSCSTSSAGWGDVTRLSLSHESGVVVSHELSYGCASARHRLVIHGTCGSLEVLVEDGSGRLRLHHLPAGSATPRRREWRTVADDGWLPLVDDFVHHVRSGAAPSRGAPALLSATSTALQIVSQLGQGEAASRPGGPHQQTCETPQLGAFNDE